MYSTPDADTDADANTAAATTAIANLEDERNLWLHRRRRHYTQPQHLTIMALRQRAGGTVPPPGKRSTTTSGHGFVLCLLGIKSSAILVCGKLLAIMLGGFTRSLSALVHFTLHTGAGVDSVVYNCIMA
eukprot:COSAG01_NODE_13363_length_1595_cov_4.273396_1_plen_129_part_00